MSPRRREDFIADLVADAGPVQPPGSPWASAALWLVAAWATVLFLTLAIAPFRPGAFEQLAASPRFMVETFVGLVAVLAAVAIVASLALPNLYRHRWWSGAVLTAFGCWVALYLYGLVDPTFPPSMAGKRPTCFYEILLDALLPFGLALFVLRRRYAVLERAAAGAGLGAAAAAISALVMQFACMYDAEHALRAHLLPVLIAATVGAVVARRVLPRV